MGLKINFKLFPDFSGLDHSGERQIVMKSAFEALVTIIGAFTTILNPWREFQRYRRKSQKYPFLTPSKQSITQG
ncbi:MAG: hypothetical protein E2O84_04470 [Bacteroidetes bacterium]|nr:MAG: hypothetical protein E2O84_04470 [Bacteroidota bacterium]